MFHNRPGKKPLFLVIAALLLASCGVASAYIEYPSAIVQPYINSGPSYSPSGGYTLVLPQYYPAIPSYQPITSPVLTPLAPMPGIYNVGTLPSYPTLFQGEYGLYTPGTPVLPNINPGSSHAVLPDSDDDTSSGISGAYITPIASGTILLDNMFPRGLGELNIRNARTDTDAVAILVRDGSLEPLVVVFITAGDKNTIKGILDGNYILYYTLGNDWNSAARQFNRNAGYYRIPNILTFYTTTKTTSRQFEWSYTVGNATIGYGNMVGKNAFPTF